MGRVQGMQAVQGVFVSRTVLRMAMRSRAGCLYQFCQRCHLLVIRSEGCNHMT